MAIATDCDLALTGERPVCRFAPSPNGYLHLGHGLSAIDGFETAQRLGGRFLIRIEDIDAARCREDFVTGIFEDLAWLGLTWDTPVLRQSQHFQRSKALAQKLWDMDVLYRCFATRSEIVAAVHDAAARDPDGALIYPGLHKGLAPEDIAARMRRGEPYALRLDMTKALALADDIMNGQPLTFVEVSPMGKSETVAARPGIWGDAIMVRKDTPTSYHLSVVADDAHQGVTRVTRGRDLYEATCLHRLLQVLLQLPEPKYSHHRLLMDGDGRKLAKSAGDTSLRELRSRGTKPEDIKRMLQLA